MTSETKFNPELTVYERGPTRRTARHGPTCTSPSSIDSSSSTICTRPGRSPTATSTCHRGWETEVTLDQTEEDPTAPRNPKAAPEAYEESDP